MQFYKSHKTLAIAVFFSSCLLSAPMAFANPFAAQNKQDFDNLVAKVTKGRVVYVDHFPGPGSLTGIILKGPNKDSKQIIAWNPPGTDLLMVGRLIDSTGTDLTQIAHNYFLSESDTSGPLSFGSIEPELEFFPFSSPESLSEKSKIIHVITDPSCHHCVKLTRDLDIFKEDLTGMDIRIVPIGRPGDGEKAAANILKYGPVLAESQTVPTTQEGVSAVKRNVELLVGVFPKLKTPMVLVDGKPIENTINALLSEEK